MKSLKNACFLFLIAILFFGCDKDDNCETGPQGPAGQNGVDGQDGTLELFSKEITINAAAWIACNTSNNSNDSAAVAIPELTQAIVDSGVVVCYRKSGNHYWILPYSEFDGIAVMTFQAYYYTGTLVFTCNANYVGGLTTGTETFKVVIANSHFKYAAQPVNWSDYGSVMRMIGK